MKRVNVYDVISEMREQIVKTMQERGIKELQTVMSYAEWCKENKRDPEEDDYDEQYDDYKRDESPYVIFFDKYNHGIDYRVDKVTLKTEGLGAPVLEFDCVNDEWGYDDTFGENDLVFMTLYNVYDTLLDRLGIEDEPKPIWVLFAESLYDYEIVRRVINVFEDEGDARKAFAEEVKEARKCATTNEWEIGNDNENFFEAYPDGSWGTSHETVELNQTLMNEKITCRN